MIIDCISDLHGTYPELHGGDLLIIAGDLTARDLDYQHVEFLEWLDMLKDEDGVNYDHIVFIAGNHDGHLVGKKPWKTPWNIEYLCDSATTYKGLKIYGSPWTPNFGNWHFMKPRGKEIRKVWQQIPDDTDILVTHGPAFGTLDTARRGFGGGKHESVGCHDLADEMLRLKNLKLHVFGHIHGGYGQCHAYYDAKHPWDDKPKPMGALSVNCALMNEDYDPVNKPIRVEL